MRKDKCIEYSGYLTQSFLISILLLFYFYNLLKFELFISILYVYISFYLTGVLIVLAYYIASYEKKDAWMRYGYLITDKYISIYDKEVRRKFILKIDKFHFYKIEMDKIDYKYNTATVFFYKTTFTEPYLTFMNITDPHNIKKVLDEFIIAKRVNELKKSKQSPIKYFYWKHDMNVKAMYFGLLMHIIGIFVLIFLFVSLTIWACIYVDESYTSGMLDMLSFINYFSYFIGFILSILLIFRMIRITKLKYEIVDGKVYFKNKVFPILYLKKMDQYEINMPDMFSLFRINVRNISIYKNFSEKPALRFRAVKNYKDLINGIIDFMHYDEIMERLE
ncbi:MAG: hypothetical protein ACTSPQ_19880 [Candidatus Helarchaeota archaeon]